MKNSIKISVITLMFAGLTALQSNAQSKINSQKHGSEIRLSIGADAGIPSSNLKDGYDWNFGGSVQADFPILKDQLYATLNSGYNYFFAKSNSKLDDLHLIPVKAGIKYFPVRCFYVQGEAGASFLTDKGNLGSGSRSAVFVYAPQAGILLNVGGSNYIDAGFRFEGNTKFNDNGKTSNFLALRVAYAFNL